MIKMNLLALLWGPMMVISLIGWGWLVSHFLYSPKSSEWGIKAALGLAFSVVIGGVLNLFSLISPRAILIYLGLGVVILLFFIIYKFRDIIGGLLNGCRTLKRDKLLACLTTGLILLFFYQYVVAAFSNFNLGDDYQAYFVYPEKMIQTGSMGDDPFSDRRMTTALGGQYFLDTFVLAVLPFDYLHLSDRGAGWLILILLIWDIFRRYKISSKATVLVIASFMLFPWPLANITGQITTVALFTVLIGFTYFKDKFEQTSVWRRAILIALIAAALCAIKSTVIAACALYFIFYYALTYYESVTRKEKLDVFKAFAISSILVLAALLPWMFSMYHSSGTLLYPIFGKGFYGTVYGDYAAPYSELSYANLLNVLYQLAGVLFVALFLYILFAWRSVQHDDALRRRLRLVILATVSGMAVCAFMTAGLGVFRYTFTFVFAAIILLTVNFIGEREKFQGRLTSLKYDSVAFIIIAVIFGAGALNFFSVIKENLNLVYTRLFNNSESSFNDFFDDIKVSGGAGASDISERTGYQKLQDSIPADSIMLTRLEKPFLLDFTRNTIYIIDMPGAASLPPGLPFFKGSEALAEYLLSKNIRYVAYSYSTDCLFTREVYLNTLKSTTNIWQRTATKDTFDFNDNLKELGATRKRLFDDGHNFVLDLQVKN
ncbi:MAG: hypothetical protein M0Q92_13340 [Methanoregula sp.]|jgi:hypothetical protein|nr:hypothetical protein [Methanoregula sp.]